MEACKKEESCSLIVKWDVGCGCGRDASDKVRHLSVIP